MKLLLTFGLIFWVVCGLAGAWRLDDLHWKAIARGPLTLVEAINEDPLTVPKLT
jgi:hypothetical protein